MCHLSDASSLQAIYKREKSEHYAYPFTLLKDDANHLTSLWWYSVSKIYHVERLSGLHLHPIIILDLCTANICSYKAKLLDLQICELFTNVTAGCSTWGVSKREDCLDALLPMLSIMPVFL